MSPLPCSEMAGSELCVRRGTHGDLAFPTEWGGGSARRSEATVVNLETSHRLPRTLCKDVLWGGRSPRTSVPNRHVRTAEGDVTGPTRRFISRRGRSLDSRPEGIFEEKGNVPDPDRRYGGRPPGGKERLAPHVHVLRVLRSTGLDELGRYKGPCGDRLRRHRTGGRGGLVDR